MLVPAQLLWFSSTSIKDALNTVVGALNGAREHLASEEELEDLHRGFWRATTTEFAGANTCEFFPLRRLSELPNRSPRKKVRLVPMRWFAPVVRTEFFPLLLGLCDVVRLARCLRTGGLQRCRRHQGRITLCIIVVVGIVKTKVIHYSYRNRIVFFALGTSTQPPDLSKFISDVCVIRLLYTILTYL
jgi:hypothetical protein